MQPPIASLVSHRSASSGPSGRGQSLAWEELFLAAPLPASVSRRSDGTLLAVNDAWVRLTGTPRDKALGRTSVELGRWASAARRAEILERIEQGKPLDTPMPMANGVVHHVRIHGTQINAEGEELLLLYLEDISALWQADEERRRLDAEIQQKNLELRQRVELHVAMETLGKVGFWTNATDDEEVFWSPGLHVITGLPEGVPLSRASVRSYIHPDDRDDWLAARNLGDGRSLDFRWMHPDGRTRWFRTQMSRTTVADNPQTYFGVVQDVTVERAIGQALEEQLHLLRQIAARVPGVIYRARRRADGYTDIVYVNDKVRDLLEIAPADLQRDSRLLFKRLCSEDIQGILLGLQVSARHMSVWQTTFRAQLPSRGLRWFQVEAVPEREADGTVLWHGFVWDVTEGKLARDKLQETSAQLSEKTAALQVTFDSISQGLAVIDRDGHVRFHNRRLLELLNLPPALLDHQPLLSDVVRFQRERGDFGENLSLVDEMGRAQLLMDAGWDRSGRYLRKTPDGRVIEIMTRPLDGGGVVRTYSDVTPFMEVEAALREERQRLQWVLEATRPGIWETSLETWEMKINSRWAEMLGYTLDELQPTTFDTWRRLVHPTDLQRAQRILEQHWAGDLPYYECDVRMRHKDGRWIWVNDRGRVHRRDAQGRALYMSGTHLDIHDRVEAQEEVRALNDTLERRVAERTAALERSMRDVESISYSIAHDLRAPLRSVNGFAGLILDEEAGRLSPGGREMFERIQRSSRNMGQMISDMLELLRVVQADLDMVPVDMNTLAVAALEALVPHDRMVRVDLQPLPSVLGDPTLLRQVLTNLMDNALKYSRHRDIPELSLGYDPGRQAFFIRDNGMGFDMARADKLFGLFQRLHAGSEVPGTGIGLAIVARIIERHGGRIWAESSPDSGSCFWWTLSPA